MTVCADGISVSYSVGSWKCSSCSQAEALQQTRKQLRELEMGVQEQQHSLDQLAAEKDACKSGAHEAADRSKVHAGVS